MNEQDPLDLQRIDQEIRINELKAQAEELAGEPIAHHEVEECPPDLQEAYWSQIVEYEKAEWTSHHEQLEKRGHHFPPPEELDDAALTAKLWDLIHALAQIQVFLHCTNHLSDRELYTDLLGESLHERVKDMPVGQGGSWHHDCIGSGSEDDTQLWLKHYADDKARARWAEQFPDDAMPAHEDPPFDRDRQLPRWELDQNAATEEQDPDNDDDDLPADDFEQE